MRRGSCVFAGVLALVVVGLVISPRAYQSEARLYVRVGRESIGLDPTATTGQTISLSDSREFEMNSVMDVIDSRAVLERVVDSLGAETILSGRLPAVPATAARESPSPPAKTGEHGMIRAATTAGGEGRGEGENPVAQPSAASSSPATGERGLELAIAPRDPAPSTDRAAALRRDRAVRALSDAMKTKSSKRSSVIAVSCRSSSPEFAQRLLQAFLDAFQALHLNASRATGSHAFFDEQCRLLAEQLESATNDLSAAKSAVGLTSIEGRQKTLEDQVAAIQSAAVKNAAALAASEATIAALQETLAALPEKLVTQEVTGFPDDSVGTTRKHLADLRLKEQELLVRFTPQHPYVLAIRQQIDAGEQMLARRDPQVSQATTSKNPNREQLHLRLLGEDATAAALRAEGDSLDRQAQKLTLQLQALNGRDAQITRLQQRVDVLKAGLKGYAEKLEQARIDQALASERISNVSVIQPATYSPRPVSPKMTLALMAGFVVAALSALGAMFAAEYLPAFVVRPVTAQAAARTT